MARLRQPSAQWMIAILVPLVITLGFVAIFVGGGGLVQTSGPQRPAPTVSLYTDPNGPAAREADALAADPSSNSRDLAVAERLAEVPTAIWLLPEEYPSQTIRRYVSRIISAAFVSGDIPVFVVYGVPDRDCGGASSGGVTSGEYARWVDQIAQGIGRSPAWVILEPDSLAITPQCANPATRIADISTAVDTLSRTDAQVYLDAGHSNWLPVSQMASLLEQVGVSKVRGFATNVSNFNSTASEQAYANELSATLGGAHYVIDTSRNGNGPTSTSEWCNPAGRALGEVPSTVPVGNQDALLWIKQPGESDGECNGGPAAGVWWTSAANELATNAGW